MLKYYEVFTSFRIATSFFLMKFLTFLNQILSQFSYAFPTAAKCSFKIYLLRPAFEIEKRHQKCKQNLYRTGQNVI